MTRPSSLSGPSANVRAFQPAIVGKFIDASTPLAFMSRTRWWTSKQPGRSSVYEPGLKPHSSGGHPTVAAMPNAVRVFSPWKTHSSTPSALRTTLGTWSAHFAGTWFLNMSGGSIMWSSMLTRIMSFMSMAAASQISSTRVHRSHEVRRRRLRPEGHAIDKLAVALLDDRADLVCRRNHGAGIENVIGDEAGHRRPVAGLGQPAQLHSELGPAVQLEHRTVGGRGGIEGGLSPDLRDGRLHLLIGAGGEKDGRLDAEPVERLARQATTPGQRRHGALPDPPGGRERVTDEPVRHLAGNLRHHVSDTRDQYGRRTELVRRCDEHRRHQRVPVVRAVEGERLSRRP